MDFSIFLAIGSDNPEEARTAAQVIEAQFENPEFLPFVCQSITTHAMTNPELGYRLALVLVSLVKKTWVLELYSDDVRMAARQSMANAAFQLSDPIALQILAALGIIIRTSQEFNTDLANSSLAVLTQNPTLTTIDRSCKILFFWAKSVISRTSEASDQFGSEYFPIVWSIIQSLSVDTPTTFSIARSISATLCSLMKMGTTSLSTEYVTSLYIFMVQCLQISSLHPSAIKMKKRIFKLLHWTMKTTNPNEANPNRLTFFSTFHNTVVPVVIAAIPRIYQSLDGEQNGMIDNALAELLDMTYAFVHISRAAASKILTPSFIQEILRPCACLRMTDLEEFQVQPEQFIASAFCGVESYHPIVLRSVCAHFVSELKFDITGLLHPSAATDPVDLEARVYLLAYRHMKKKMNAELYNVLVSYVRGLLDDPQTVFAVPAFLLALRNERMNPSVIVPLAADIFMSEQHPVVALEALVLLTAALLKQRRLGSIDPGQLLTQIFVLTRIITDELIGQCLTRLFAEFSEELMPYTNELLESLINSWGPIAASADELADEGISELLVTIATIVQSLDGVTASTTIEHVLTFVAHALETFPNNHGLPDLIGIARDCCIRLTTPSPVFSRIVSFCTEILSSGTDHLYLLPQIMQVFCAILTHVPSPEFATEMVAGIEAVISQPSQEFSIVASGLFGFSVFVQILGVPAVDTLTSRALSFLVNAPHEIILIAAFCEIASALWVTDGAFASQLSNDVIQLWIEIIDRGAFKEYPKAAKVAMIGIVQLIRGGNHGLIEHALTLITTEQFHEGEPNRQEEEEEEDKEEDIDDEIGSGIFDLLMPMDKVNERGVLANVLKEIGFWNQLSPEQQNALTIARSDDPIIV